MSIISLYNENENRFSSTVDNFLKENRIGFLLKQSNFYKEKGISCAISEFLDYFMSCLPTFLKEKLSLCFCES